MSNATATVIADQNNTFDYAFLPVSDLQVTTKENAKTGKKEVDKVLVRDEPLKGTERFWTSLFARYGFNSAFFKYYDHAEVFERISQKEKNDRMRLCIERNEKGEGTLLAVSNPTKPIVVFDELVDMLGRYNAHEVTYHNGIVESHHTPRNGANQFAIAGDDFQNRFLMATPIDGYGAPNIYLSLLRLICQNGTVGYTKAFRSSLALGKGDDDVAPSLTRALDGFGNDEGYAALRQRLENAAKSWASVYEVTLLYKQLVKLYAGKHLLEHDQTAGLPAAARNIRRLMESTDGTGVTEETVGSPLLQAFHRMTGDTSALYGLANLDALSVKRQRTLPVRCTVYDAINFATEVASHCSKPSGARALQAWVGGLVTEEYDMENTKDRYSEFADFHVSQQLASGLTGSEPTVATAA